MNYKGNNFEKDYNINFEVIQLSCSGGVGEGEGEGHYVLGEGRGALCVRGSRGGGGDYVYSFSGGLMVNSCSCHSIINIPWAKLLTFNNNAIFVFIHCQVYIY